MKEDEKSVSYTHLDFERYGVLAIIFGLVLLMFVYVFTYPTYEAGQVMPALFGKIGRAHV